eukprot:118798-Prymnesium_polylepis.1
MTAFLPLTPHDLSAEAGNFSPTARPIWRLSAVRCAASGATTRACDGARNRLSMANVFIIIMP